VMCVWTRQSVRLIHNSKALPQ